MANSSSRDHAIVIGASIAGLGTAAALARHFERVTIVERDALDDDAAPRKGTPQSHQVHVLLHGGVDACADLFPGFLDALHRDGTQPLDWGRDFRLFHHGVWKLRDEMDVFSYPEPRLLLEARIRKQVRCLANVTVRG